MDLTVVGGGGEVGTGHVGVQFVDLALTTPGRTFSIQRGNLVVDGVRRACTTMSNIVSCSSATLTCTDGEHDVVAGGPGVGSLDGNLLTQGNIHMTCFGR